MRIPVYVKALGILLALAAVLHGFWLIFDAGGDARETSIRLEYTNKENDDLKAAQAETERQAKENSRLSGELAMAQSRIRKRDHEISKLRGLYETLAQRSNDCNLTIGSVLLHNAALGYEYDPGQLDAEGTALSTVTGSAFIDHCNRLATEFELNREQLNIRNEAQ